MTSNNAYRTAIAVAIGAAPFIVWGMAALGVSSAPRVTLLT